MANKTSIIIPQCVLFACVLLSSHFVTPVCSRTPRPRNLRARTPSACVPARPVMSEYPRWNNGACLPVLKTRIGTQAVKAAPNACAKPSASARSSGRAENVSLRKDLHHVNLRSNSMVRENAYNDDGSVCERGGQDDVSKEDGALVGCGC